MAKNWEYFDKFEEKTEKLMPARGEGNTLASQAVTAVNKLVYKWYNDGDVFDNTHFIQGWMNDLSTYANWLACFIPTTKPILDRINSVNDEGEYEDLLADLADLVFEDQLLSELMKKPMEGSIYTQKGAYNFEEPCDDDDDDDYEDWEYWDEEDE